MTRRASIPLGPLTQDSTGRTKFSPAGHDGSGQQLCPGDRVRLSGRRGEFTYVKLGRHASGSESLYLVTPDKSFECVRPAVAAKVKPKRQRTAAPKAKEPSP